MPPHRPHTKKRTERVLSPISSDEEDEEEESDVEEMNIDEDQRPDARRSKSVELKAKRYREKIEKNRRERRDRTRHRAEELRGNGNRFDFFRPPAPPPSAGDKRKGEVCMSVHSGQSH